MFKVVFENVNNSYEKFCEQLVDRIGKFDYITYLALNRDSRAVDNNIVSFDFIPVDFYVVMRTTYSNKVFVTGLYNKKESLLFYKDLNCWLDPAPFDDYSVLAAKRFIDNTYGVDMTSKEVAELVSHTSLQVTGADVINNRPSVLIQIMVDSFSNVKPPRGYFSVDIERLKRDKEKYSEVEQRIIDALVIVGGNKDE